VQTTEKNDKPPCRLFMYVHSNPNLGEGGLRGSGMVPFERPLRSFYRLSIVTFFYLYAFQRYCRFCSPERHFFPTPNSIVSPKFPHALLRVGGLPFGCKERICVGLSLVCAISLVSKISNLCDQNPPSQTDGRTDGQTDNMQSQDRALH